MSDGLRHLGELGNRGGRWPLAGRAPKSASRRMGTRSKPVPKSTGIAPNPSEYGRAATKREPRVNGSTKPRNQRGGQLAAPPYTQEVAGSIPAPPTTRTRWKRRVFVF